MPRSLSQPAPGVAVQMSNMFQMNSLVITGPSGSEGATVVVDPGWFPDEVAELKAIAAASAAGRATHVLLTHPDFDHVVGWAEFPGAELIAHPDAARRDPMKSREDVEKLDRRCGVVRPRPYRYPPATAFSAQATLDLGCETALLFAAPGHVGDALFTVLPEPRLLIAGDYLSDIEFPFIYHSLRDYRATLELARRLCREYAITCAVPGHGPIAGTPAEIARRIDTDIDYLDDLRAAVGRLHGAGASLDEAAEQLRQFSFRGAPLPPELAGEHRANIKFLYEHPDELR